MEGGNGVPTRAILTALWAISTSLWSIFTPPQHTFAVRVLLFQPAWLLRALFGDSTWIQDLAILLPLSAAYGYLVGHWHILGWDDLQWLDPRDDTMRLYLQIFALLAMCSLFAGGIVFRGRRLHPRETDEPSHEHRIDEQVLPPLLLPSRTTHSRLFPKKHAFSYSYLLVGIPVGMHGRISRLLSVDTQQPGWFHVDSADFLDRGHEGSTLAEKLNAYLHTQGVTDRDYAFAYLVTAPRFLGYSFNPVSFWYLYDSDTELKYMILEVNNTFDERRMYLLKGGEVKGEEMDDGSDRPFNGAGKTSKQLVFTDSWTKDFHVSPFNSRKGSYSLRATDPLAEYEQTGRVRIDNTIVLRSSKEHPKLLARVFSEGEAHDPASVSAFEAARFIALWCWVGFATFPRIVWQAAKLSLRRNLHVWYRPEVTDASISRPYTDDEKQLEPFFRAFLAHVVQEASDPLRIVYEPAHSEGSEVVYYSPSFTYEEDHQRTLTLKVLYPAFYSRFVHYPHWSKALDYECLAKDERNRTARLEGTAQLPEPSDAIDDKAQYGSQGQEKTRSIGLLDQVRWACMRRLRCPPASYAYPENLSSEHHTPAVSNAAPSELDVFVRTHCSDADTYRRITTKLFLAQRICLGIPALLDVLDYLFRSMLLLASMIYSDRTRRPVDMFRSRQLDLDDFSAVACMLMLANSIHIWSFLKA
ncbi:hypothetical protein B0A55_11282 [Friedmanniomyces simplex]|uniref:DUF1365 domain-containing protein n=1 Tax=Friedmanniomyces simplex TaxID=329884 RepID=A0A4V5NFR9_9PEZI|nr:hypothetical protein B0A55_11282 [Friedmanniomyces simplex]